MTEFEPCSICARTPLVGETVTVFGAGGSEAVACELCLGRPRARALGEPLRRERVRSAAGAETVSPLAPEPALHAVVPQIAESAAIS